MKTFFKKTIQQSTGVQKTSGFTIIETLVAIFVLLITTTGPLVFAQNGLRASFLARDQVTAFYLAQEPVEIFKNIRDANHIIRNIFGLDWLEGFNDCYPGAVPGETTSCNIGLRDSNNDFGVVDCGGETCTNPLRYNPENKTFVVDGANPESKYTRTVYVTLINDNEIQVIVEVKWQSQFLADKRVVIQENIYKKY
jgi:type II secretory pathway pseudopilin PulG